LLHIPELVQESWSVYPETLQAPTLAKQSLRVLQLPLLQVPLVAFQDVLSEVVASWVGSPGLLTLLSPGAVPQ
jgi:hypothetical protein